MSIATMQRPSHAEADAVGVAGRLRITVLICTHNRRDLLARTIASLNAAARPVGADVELLVVANACTDDTHAYLEAYRRNTEGRLPLRWIAEPTPGKSNALNRAFGESLCDVVAFVDDDHRVDSAYLVAISAAVSEHPDIGLFCGRILPDWDGSEPAWVHDEGKYRVYPLPVPRFDLGDEPGELTLRSSVPGGGNLIARRDAIHATGSFAIDLGPVGHDLGGAEDLDWVRRSLRTGIRLRYCPDIVQFHYVDGSRLRLDYVVRKGYSRSKSVMKLDRRRTEVRPYMWRKLVEYAVQMVFTVNEARRRFFLVRLAAALGEIHGVMANRRDARARASMPYLFHDVLPAALLGASVLAFAIAGSLAGPTIGAALVPVSTVAALATLVLVVKSVRDFSQTGPRIRDEILNRYRVYTLYATTRLVVWIWLIFVFFGAAGAILYGALAWAAGAQVYETGYAIAAALGMAVATLVQMRRKLLDNPGLLIASWQYRLSRLNTWRDLVIDAPARRFARAAPLVLALMLVLAFVGLLARGESQDAVALLCAVVGYGVFLAWAGWAAEPPPVRKARRDRRFNVLMIGADTLRADRVLNPTYPRRLAPNIERLAERASAFPHCYVPCARTAPSLISLFSGTWPHTHGVRDNFVAGDDTRLPINMLPERLRDQGYRTASVSDWCGADLGKFSFGFDLADVPDDQWNLRYLIRQGPKDLRLLLSLFCHNRFGRTMLPEIYYLGGVPQTDHMGRRARETLSRLAATDAPFLLNVFLSTTHPPFASETPHFEMYASREYRGESRYAMARLNDPFDIIRRQGDTRQEFDLEQIIDLYDGCVTRFDTEVGKILAHLEACGLSDNTIVVIYSDHGMEFFEHETWGQGNSAIGDFSPRVPLVIYHPKLGHGMRCETVVRSIDVAPTLAELLGCEYLGTEGVSLRPLMEGKALPDELAAFSETGMWVTEMPGLPAKHLRYPDLFELLDVIEPAEGTLAVKEEYRLPVIRAKDRMIRRGRWKLVFQPLEDGIQLRLYDLVTDPGCTRDLSRCETRIAGELWAELRAWMAADPLMNAAH